MTAAPSSRTLDEVLHLIVPDDRPFDARLLFDAMYANVHFRSREAERDTPTFPIGRAADGTLTVLGHRAKWAEAEVDDILTTTFGPNAPERVSHFVAAYRNQPVDDLDDAFLFAVAIIVWGGADKDDWMRWERHDPEGTNGKGLGHLCPAYWIARWGKDTLNTFVAAGYSTAELFEIYEAGVLPDPDAVATLARLRGHTV